MAAYTQGKRLDEMAIGEIMSRPVQTCRPEDGLDRVATLMANAQVRRLPVVGVGGGLQIRNATLEFSKNDGERLVAPRDVGPVPLLRVVLHRESGLALLGSRLKPTACTPPSAI